MKDRLLKSKTKFSKKKIIFISVLLICCFLIYIVFAFFFGGNKPLISYGTNQEYEIQGKQDLLSFSEYRYTESFPQIWDSFCIELDVSVPIFERISDTMSNKTEIPVKGRLAFEKGIYYLSFRRLGLHFEIVYDSLYKAYAQSVSGSTIFSTFFEIEKTNGWECSQNSANLIWADLLLWQLKNFLGKPLINMLTDLNNYSEFNNVYNLTQTQSTLNAKQLQSFFSFDYIISNFSLYHPCEITQCSASINLQNTKSPKLEYSINGFFSKDNVGIFGKGTLRFCQIGNTSISLPQTVKQEWLKYDGYNRIF